MSVLLGIVMLLAFLLAVWVIFRGTSPIIVLLVLAIAWTLLAGSSFRDLLANVLQKGGEQYASTIVIIVFGAWFGQVLVQTGIAESMIRTAVELAGDRPIAVAWAVSLITGLLFTSIYGDQETPASAQLIDPPGQIPDAYRGADPRISQFELALWQDFWKLFQDENYRKEKGVVATFGQDVWGPFEPDKLYTITLQANGSLSLTSAPLKPIYREAMKQRLPG